MRGREYAFLDLTALPAVGAVLLADSPVLLWSADARRVLWANAAGAAFFGEREMAALIERRFSPALPSSDRISRFARSAPLGASRLERIRFAAGGELANLAVLCTRVALPDGEDAVLTALQGVPARATSPERLTSMLAAEDCLVAILDEAGRLSASSGGFETLAAGEAAIEGLVSALDSRNTRLIKRVIRIDDTRRPAGIVRVEAAGAVHHLLIVGPAERIVIEPAEPVPALPPIAEPQPSAEPAAAATELTEPPTLGAPPVASPVVELPAPAVGGIEADTQIEAPEAPQAPTTLPAGGETAHEGGALAAETPSAAIVPETAPGAQLSDAPAPDAREPDARESDAKEPGESQPGTPATGSAPPFRYVEPTGPSRFVFQMDGEGRFTFVSPDLAAAVGPISAGIVGSNWRDVAAARGLDRDGTVAAVIARRDTWSGVTLEWPVDGADERVAVDLAALPAFSRDRAFEGYRGFGVIRPLDRRREPARGPNVMALTPPSPSAPSPAPTNVVRLPRAGTPAEGERLSMPEQDAFRRIAAALGAEPPARQAATPPPAETPPAEAPIAEVPVAEIPVAETPVAEPVPSEPPPPADADSPPETAAELPPTAPPESAPVPDPTIVSASPPEPVRSADPDARLRALEAEQKIVELEAILDTATDGVVVVDGEGVVERINRSAEALFGVDTAEVVGRPFTDLLAQESRKSALDYLDGLARNGVASVLNDGREVIGRVPQGGLIPLFMTMGRLAGTGKFCAVLRDITQWKNAEEELINARRAAESASMQKSDFLAKVSHEIRTPLNAIIGFSEVMMEERFGPIGTERYKEYLRDIHVSGAHLMSLLNDLLDLSKIEAGKLDLSFEAVSLNDIVMECVALMQPQANRERIIIRTSLSGQVPSIVADPRSIRQIVLNLVSNAVKFTLAGGQVIVSTVLEEQGEVTLRIRDTGVGMSEKDIETALKPFRQLSTSRERRSDGTGLGLPLTKALVEANRAAFQIVSTVGQGTLIRITFPTTRVLAG